MLAGYFVAHFQELFHPLTKPEGRHRIRSISTPSLPLCRASWNHISGIVHCESNESCSTVSDLIWLTPFRRLPRQYLLDRTDILRDLHQRTSSAGQDWLPCLTPTWPPASFHSQCLVDHTDILYPHIQADVTSPPHGMIRLCP